MTALAISLSGSLLIGCKPDAGVAGKADPPKPGNWDTVDAAELIRPDSGAVIADRSGEWSYDRAAVSVLDAASETYWSSPPDDPEQWLVVDLPALTRVARVGVSTSEAGGGPAPPKKLRFEGSSDGQTFTELRTVDIVKGRDRQLFDVSPIELRAIRLTMLATPDGPGTPSLPTLHVRGEELEPFSMPQFAGHWSIDGRPLDISQAGNVIYAVAPMKPPMIFHGTVQGRAARLTWSRGNESGVAWLAVNPASNRLSGYWWWADPLMNLIPGEAWYGERQGDAPGFVTPISTIAQVHLRKVGRFPLYGLAVRPDGELDLEASRTGIEFILQALEAFPQYRVRLEVFEPNSWIKAKNMEVATDRAKRLRAGLVHAGVPEARLIVETGSREDVRSPLQRFLYTRVDFSLAGS